MWVEASSGLPAVKAMIEIIYEQDDSCESGVAGAEGAVDSLRGLFQLLSVAKSSGRCLGRLYVDKLSRDIYVMSALAEECA